MNVIRSSCSQFGQRFLRSLFSDIGFQYKTLFSQSALGLDNYAVVRDRTTQQFANSQEKFKNKMKEFVEAENGSMIFTEDLKSIVHLADSNAEDLELVKNMIYKFNTQNKELRFGSYIFGPVIMRMYYYLNKPDEAMLIFKDESLDGFFDQFITYQLLLDLLYNNEKYNEILDVFEIIKSKQLNGTKYPKNVVVLCFGACYKLNTEESFKYATNLWHELKDVGHIPMRKAVTFAAALALKQNSPHIALEIVSSEPKQTYVSIRNIKAICLSELGRPDDAIALLRTILVTDEPTTTKHTFLMEVINKIKEAVEKHSDKDLKTEFQRIEKQLAQHGHITEQSLDTLLCAEIQNSLNRTSPTQNRILAASYNRRNTYGGSGFSGGGGLGYRKRPGLRDLN